MALEARITIGLVLAGGLGVGVAWLVATVRSGMRLSQAEAEWELCAAGFRAELQAGREREGVMAAAQKSLEQAFRGREVVLGTELEERRERILVLGAERTMLTARQLSLESSLARCQSEAAASAGELDHAAERVRQLEALPQRIVELQQTIRGLELLAEARASANEELQRHLLLREEAAGAVRSRLGELLTEHEVLLRQRDAVAEAGTRYQALLAAQEAEAQNRLRAAQFEEAPSRSAGGTEAAERRSEQAARARLQSRLAELEPLSGRVRELERQLAESERNRGELVRDLESEIRTLRGRLMEAEGDEAPGARSAASLRGAERTRPSAIRTGLEPAAAEPDRSLALQAEVAVLREVIASRDREILALREAPEPPAPAGAATARRPATRGGDELTRIRGIGPVLERLLRRLGVTRFRQIARWSERDIERMARRLEGFPDRIRRDRWVEGARREYIRKYGRDPITGEPVLRGR